MHGLLSFTKRCPDLYLSSGMCPFPPIVSLHAERAFHPSQVSFTPSIGSIPGCQPNAPVKRIQPGISCRHIKPSGRSVTRSSGIDLSSTAKTTSNHAVEHSFSITQVRWLDEWKDYVFLDLKSLHIFQNLAWYGGVYQITNSQSPTRWNRLDLVQHTLDQHKIVGRDWHSIPDNWTNYFTGDVLSSLERTLLPSRLPSQFSCKVVTTSENFQPASARLHRHLLQAMHPTLD
jgi:hypothetical protein